MEIFSAAEIFQRAHDDSGIQVGIMGYGRRLSLGLNDAYSSRWKRCGM